MTESDPHYSAFVSYASEDREAAFEVADRLEEAGLACWVAPRDVRVGQDYGAEIIRGIEQSDALVLVLSQHSNDSKFVKAEVERAYSKNKTVFPVRIEDVMPAPHLELFVSSSHWVDAFQGNLDDHFEILIREVGALASREDAPAASLDKSVKRSKLGKSQSRVPLMGAGAVAVVAIAMFFWQWSKTPPESDAPENSVAVIPFVNMSSDPEQEYFSDGIAEELLNILSQIRELKVAARTSSFQFKGEKLDVANIGVQLNVAHVLEGSVRKAGNRVRVTAQLIDADTGYNLWSETFDRELDDIFAIQDEISGAIVAAMKDVLHLQEGETLPTANASSSTVAYDQYLLGKHFMQTRQKASLEKAIEHFVLAIEVDPSYAPAYAAQSLAWSLLLSGYARYGDLTLEESVGRALPLANKALELDPDLAEAYVAMGTLRHGQQNYEEAINQYDKAIALNPNYALAYSSRGLAALSLGRYDMELESLRKAAELDALAIVPQGNYVHALFRRGRYDDLGPGLERVKALGPHYYAYSRYWHQWHQGQYSDAIITLIEGRESEPEFRPLETGLTYMLSVVDLRTESERLLNRADRKIPWQWQGDWEKVIEFALEDFSANPDDLRTVAALGQAYLAGGDIESATPLLERYTQAFDDGIGPLISIAGYVGLIRQIKGDANGVASMLESLKAREKRAIVGGLDNVDLDVLTMMAALVEGNEEKALDATEKIATGPGVDPSMVASLRGLTQLNNNARFDQILDAQAAHMTSERARILERICGGATWKNWQPLRSTCDGWATTN